MHVISLALVGLQPGLQTVYIPSFLTSTKVLPHRIHTAVRIYRFYEKYTSRTKAGFGLNFAQFAQMRAAQSVKLFRNNRTESVTTAVVLKQRVFCI